MILSEFIRVLDLNWLDFLYSIFWFFIFIGLYTSLVIGYSRTAAVNHFKKNIMPELYDGKLKIVKEELRLLKIDNKQLRHDNQNYSDRIRVIRKSVEG